MKGVSAARMRGGRLQLPGLPGPAPHTGIGVEGSPHRTRSQSCMGWREETEFAELLERNPCLMLTQTFYDQRLRQDRRGAVEGSRASTSLSSSTTVMGGSRLSSRTGTALSTARTKLSMSGGTSASSSAASRSGCVCVRAQRGRVQACLYTSCAYGHGHALVLPLCLQRHQAR